MRVRDHPDKVPTIVHTAGGVEFDYENAKPVMSAKEAAAKAKAAAAPLPEAPAAKAQVKAKAKAAAAAPKEKDTKLKFPAVQSLNLKCVLLESRRSEQSVFIIPLVFPFYGFF